MKKSHSSKMRLIPLLLRENWPDAETLAKSQSSVADFHMGFPMPESSNCFHSLHSSCDARYVRKGTGTCQLYYVTDRENFCANSIFIIKVVVSS